MNIKDGNKNYLCMLENVSTKNVVNKYFFEEDANQCTSLSK